MAFDVKQLTDNQLRVAKAVRAGLPDRVKDILRAEWVRRDLGNKEKYPDEAPPFLIEDLDVDQNDDSLFHRQSIQLLRDAGDEQ